MHHFQIAQFSNSYFYRMKPLYLLLFTVLLPFVAFSQPGEFAGFPADYTTSPKGKTGIRLMFYNLENLFYPENDSLKNDDSFTPEGDHHWNMGRYREKLEKTYKVMASVGGWEPPAIIGFCELENRLVIHELVTTTPLARYGYQVIHEESGDARGIDVALVYRADKFRPFTHTAHRLYFNGDTVSSTRDILMVGGTVLGKDTLFVFVNHWPSKFGGAKETEPRRLAAAEKCRQVFDSLSLHYPRAGIVFMGDFNDEPQEPSLVEGLRALEFSGSASPRELYNLMLRFKDGGTHKFQKMWSIIDQFIVSGNLLQGGAGLSVKPEEARIFKADFLVEADETNLGDRPYRTYAGMKYQGGFSDHLPIYLDIWMK